MQVEAKLFVMKKLSLWSANGAGRRVALTGLGLVGAVVLFSGCKTDEDIPVDRTAMLSADDQVSSVPWNKPQGWENKGGLGALQNDPRIGGQQ